jgi:hypothetical protein
MYILVLLNKNQIQLSFFHEQTNTNNLRIDKNRCFKITAFIQKIIAF